MSLIFNRPEYRARRKKLRNNTPVPELIIWGYLRRKQLCGMKFRRQQGIGHYIVDFYCPYLLLVIEIDGNTHYSEEQIRSDKIRQQWIESLGIKVIRFRNDEVIQATEIVLERIKIDIKKRIKELKK
ncbi:MAG: endonuclease domain-containing protein [bacterium]